MELMGNPFLNMLKEYWAIISWAGATLFALGVLWYKVESLIQLVKDNNDSRKNETKLLFHKTDMAETFMAAQAVENRYLKEQLLRTEISREDHQKEAAARYASLVIRIDQIYADMVKNK